MADTGERTPVLIRGARAMLGWSMVDLARAAGVSVSTIKRVENGEAVRSTGMLGQIRSALEAAGVTFLTDDGDGPGVRLRPQRRSVFSRHM